jgi:hypothetical protein
VADRLGISLHIGVERLDPACYPLKPPHPDWPDGWDGPLLGCANDARDMQSIAKSQGFETTLLMTENATADNVIAAIRDASKRLSAGDIFMLTYAGHGGQVLDRSGDEADREDETWCLYDRHLLDDELYSLYADFDAGVRILILSDSCHSGTVNRGGSEAAKRSVRAMPRNTVFQIYKAREAFYNEIQDRVTAEGHKEVKAAIRLFAACQDHQEATGAEENGFFTAAVKRVWDGGNFDGDYDQFYEAVKADLVAAHADAGDDRGAAELIADAGAQIPNRSAEGADNQDFDRQKPFSI